MEEYNELPNLKMTALAVLYKNKWNSKKINRSNDFIVKESLSQFASSLEDDDIGYLYNPLQPNELCINPGELVGKISNTNLVYNFNFMNGVKYVISMLKSLDNSDYNRIGIIVSDCLEKNEVDEMESYLNDCEDIKIYKIGIGKCFCFKNMIYVRDAAELKEILEDIKKNTTISR